VDVIAFLMALLSFSWNQHPEPTGSRRATPLRSPFQHPTGHPPRPSVRQSPVKNVEQQAARVTQRTHELLSRQRVTLINALRGHLAEFGILATAGPQACRTAHREAGRSYGAHNRRRSRRVECRRRPTRRSWPRDRSDGGADAPFVPKRRERRASAHHSWRRPDHRQRDHSRRAEHTRLSLGSRLRSVAWPCAEAKLNWREGTAIRWGCREPGFSESWIGRLIARKPMKLAAVALANKMARIVWAVLTRGEVYRTT